MHEEIFHKISFVFIANQGLHNIKQYKFNSTQSIDLWIWSGVHVNWYMATHVYPSHYKNISL